LKGENIPLDARILSVADSYDAMTSLRPYREGKLNQEEALAELKRCSGTQFDPKIVDVFVAAREGQQLQETEPNASHIEASAAG
jgi:HD-GYP domain-containing protein (c-di-GMP phosphodiesterase class II)